MDKQTDFIDEKPFFVFHRLKKDLFCSMAKKISVLAFKQYGDFLPGFMPIDQKEDRISFSLHHRAITS